MLVLEPLGWPAWGDIASPAGHSPMQTLVDNSSLSEEWSILLGAQSRLGRERQNAVLPKWMDSTDSQRGALAGKFGAGQGMQRSLYADLVTRSFVSIPHLLCWLHG